MTRDHLAILVAGAAARALADLRECIPNCQPGFEAATRKLAEAFADFADEIGATSVRKPGNVRLSDLSGEAKAILLKATRVTWWMTADGNWRRKGDLEYASAGAMFELERAEYVRRFHSGPHVSLRLTSKGGMARLRLTRSQKQPERILEAA